MMKSLVAQYSQYSQYSQYYDSDYDESESNAMGCRVMKIVNLFNTTNCLAVTVLKKTKVGADGLMLELAKLFATYPDDKFIVTTAAAAATT
jgi:hypothetical protein